MELARYIRCLENQWPLTHNPTHNRRLEFITLASARPAAREPPRRLIGLLMPLAADDTGTGEPRIMARASPVTIPEVNLVEWRLLNPPHPSVLTSSHSDRLDATWIVRRERSGGNDPGERTPGRKNAPCGRGVWRPWRAISDVRVCESPEEWRARCARVPTLPKRAGGPRFV